MYTAKNWRPYSSMAFPIPLKLCQNHPKIRNTFKIKKKMKEKTTVTLLATTYWMSKVYQGLQ